MAQQWSPSPASLVSIFAVLSAHDHPFVMVGGCALQWMGLPAHRGSILDILIRTSQAAPIYKALVETGEWLEVDKSSIPVSAIGAERMDRRSIRQLKRYDDQWYISLCIERYYCLTVDTKKIQVPHVAGYGRVLVESEFHPAQSPADEGFLSMVRVLGDENVKFVRGEPVTFPVFIPTIPQFLDACMDSMRSYTFVDDGSCRTPQADMDELFCFLALLCPHQQDKILAKVKNGKQLAVYFAELEPILERTKMRRERRAKSAINSKSGLGPPLVMRPL